MKGSETTTLAPDERRTRAQAVTQPPDIETSYKPAPGYSQETHNRPLALLTPSCIGAWTTFGKKGEKKYYAMNFSIHFLLFLAHFIIILVIGYSFHRRIYGFHQEAKYQNSKCLKRRSATAADCVLWLLSPGLLPVAQCQNCQSLVNLRQIKCSFIV